MPAISASATFHGVKTITASSSFTSGAPLTLTLNDGKGPNCFVTIFTDDADYTRRLIDAINDAAKPVEPAEPCPHEEAAYQAAAMHYLVNGSAP